MPIIYSQSMTSEVSANYGRVRFPVSEPELRARGQTRIMGSAFEPELLEVYCSSSLTGKSVFCVQNGSTLADGRQLDSTK